MAELFYVTHEVTPTTELDFHIPESGDLHPSLRVGGSAHLTLAFDVLGDPASQLAAIDHLIDVLRLGRETLVVTRAEATDDYGDGDLEDTDEVDEIGSVRQDEPLNPPNWKYGEEEAEAERNTA